VISPNGLARERRARMSYRTVITGGTFAKVSLFSTRPSFDVLMTTSSAPPIRQRTLLLSLYLPQRPTVSLTIPPLCHTLSRSKNIMASSTYRSPEFMERNQQVKLPLFFPASDGPQSCYLPRGFRDRARNPIYNSSAVFRCPLAGSLWVAAGDT
jgi:hypothetical protein